MGKINDLISFTEKHIKNKELIINMLKYEDSLILGDTGKKIFDSNVFEKYNLETVYIFHRLTLNYFNFESDDDSVENYRKIFSYYYKNPKEYDKDVINSVAYMRENRCVFFTSEKLNVGDTYPDCQLFEIDGKTKVSIYDKINKDDEFTIIGAFSNSWPPFLKRKKYLFELEPKLKEKKINIILVQINEAHSTKWPNGLINTPQPQKDFSERVERANNFVKEDNCPFTVLIDDWNDIYDNKYQVWPDKYYCVDKNMKIVEMSKYGKTKDALIDKDCLELVYELLN